jgi:hypothetical protein
MYCCRLVKKSSSNTQWETRIKCLLHALEVNYDAKKHGLDLSKSGFLKSEVFKAEECIYAMHDTKILGFVFFFTTKRPRALYVTLLASFEKGIGSSLMRILDTSSAYTHDYIALRATEQSVGFYIKCDFMIFDFITMEDYVNGTVSSWMTDKIRNHLHDKSELRKLQQQIVDCNWIESDEFPMLKKRNREVANDTVTRKSRRLHVKSRVMRDLNM